MRNQTIETAAAVEIPINHKKAAEGIRRRRHYVRERQQEQLPGPKGVAFLEYSQSCITAYDNSTKARVTARQKQEEPGTQWHLSLQYPRFEFGDVRI